MNPSADLMPRSPGTSDAQLVFRAAQAKKVELEAVAKALDVSSAELLRQVLTDALPTLRARADREVALRDRTPHGITADVLDAAVAALLRKLAQDEPVRIEQHQLLSAESKALWTLLSFLWGERPDDPEFEAAARAVLALAKQDQSRRPPPKR